MSLNTTGQQIFSDQTARAKFIQAACFTVRSAVREASKDLYGVSGMLQTSAGRSQVQPGLVIPAEDVTFNQSPASTDNTSYHYVTNIWDTTGFASAFDQSGNPNSTSYIEAAGKRFSDLVLTEMCRTTGTDNRPSTLFVVRHVLTSQELTNLKTLGHTDFIVGMPELADSADKSIDLHIAGVTAQDFTSQNWDVPLAAPVVLGARYASCADSACATASAANLGNVSIDLIHSQDAWVPRVCLTGEAPDEVVISGTGVGLPNLSYHAVVDTCRQRVVAPPVHQALNFLDATSANSMLLQLNAELKGSGQLCNTLPSNQLLDGVQGTPLMGTWTLGEQSLLPQLQSIWTAQSVNPLPISMPTGLQGLEVLFFVGAEPKPRSAPAAYVTANP